MPIHLKKEIEKLKKMILALSANVRDSLADSLLAVQNRDAGSAQRIIDNDRNIDLDEVEIEEECLKVLALYQPVAADLRFIVAVLKINNDLERIADLAVNISERAISLSQQPQNPFVYDFQPMIDVVQEMLSISISSLIDLDAESANKVCQLDDTVDDFNRGMFKEIQKQMRSTPENIEQLLQLLSISRYLEKIADCTTNIAEDVIYMINGRIVRHNIG